MTIEQNGSIRERFIPISYNEILDGAINYLKSQNKEELKEFSALLHKHYYTTSYESIQNINSNYEYFNPDSDLILKEIGSQSYAKKESALYKEIENVLNSANYEILTQDMLESTMNETSPYGVEVNVEFDDFKEVKLYYRGKATRSDEIRDPKKLFIKKKIVIEPIYLRLFLLIKPKNTDETINDQIYIKLFKNIPQKDLEMLFPNTEIKMRLSDKLKISIFGGAGTFGGGATLFAKLGSVIIDPISALVAIGTFGGVLWRQVKGVISRKTHYMAELSSKLYFHNLSNNAGALTHLFAMAREEDSKEALLTYIFLHVEPLAITKEELDSKIEKFISSVYSREMDFEIDGGLNKLNSLGLLHVEDERVSVVSIRSAIELIKIN